MKDKFFLDTNILVYLYSEDEPNKQTISRELLKRDMSVISTQVLSEFANVLRKKFKLEYDDIERAIKQVSEACQVTHITVETVVNAVKIAKQYHYSLYDSLILASALSQHCTTVYSEDLQHRQVIENQLRIINPFS